MRLRFVWVTYALLTSFNVGRAAAQYPAPYHQLSAREFNGQPVYNTADIVAMTNCNIDFNYNAHAEKNYYLLTCNIHLIFNRDRSWIDRHKVNTNAMMDEVLKHEQGHYTIAYLEQQELLRTISRTVFSANYQREASNLFDKIHHKYEQLSQDYDADTDHMRNKQQQHSWDEYLKKKLTYLPPEELASN